mgnify:CR=1
MSTSTTGTATSSLPPFVPQQIIP